MAENKQRIQGVAAMGWNESDFSLEPQAFGSTNTSYLCPIAEIVMFCASARNIPGY